MSLPLLWAGERVEGWSHTAARSACTLHDQATLLKGMLSCCHIYTCHVAALKPGMCRVCVLGGVPSSNTYSHLTHWLCVFAAFSCRHVAVIYIALCVFAFLIYAAPSSVTPLGSISKVWAGPLLCCCRQPVSAAHLLELPQPQNTAVNWHVRPADCLRVC